MIPQYYKFSYYLCLNNLFQVWFIGNHWDQVTPLIYIIWDDEVSRLVINRRFLRDMKYLMSSVKQATETLGIWTEHNWDVKRLNSLYTMVSGRCSFRINEKFNWFSWLSIFNYFYIKMGYILGEFHEEQEQA